MSAAGLRVPVRVGLGRDGARRRPGPEVCISPPAKRPNPYIPAQESARRAPDRLPGRGYKMANLPLRWLARPHGRTAG